MPDPQQLIQLLRDELALQTRHCQHLEAQRRALIACDRAAFRQLHRQHTALLNRLKEQTAARALALTDSSGQVYSVGSLVEDLPEGKKATVAALAGSLRCILDKSQALCRDNERLIKNELDYFDFALAIFMEAGKRADVGYGGRGKWGRRKLLDRRA